MSPEKKVVEYNEFCVQWAKAVTEAKTDSTALWLMDLNVQVRCRSCKNLVDGEDAVQGAELYCPACGAGWVMFHK